MFKLLWPSKKENKLYPTFRTRIFAALIDTALAALILTPLFNITSALIYKDITPGKQLSIIIQRLSTHASDFNSLSQNLKTDKEYQSFLTQQSYKNIFMEQLVQTVAFSVIVLFFWIKYSATPGKLFLSMKIVDEKTLQKPSIIKLSIRLLACIISILPLGLGIFYIALNKKHRAWHDILSGTIVVSEKELTHAQAT